MPGSTNSLHLRFHPDLPQLAEVFTNLGLYGYRGSAAQNESKDASPRPERQQKQTSLALGTVPAQARSACRIHPDEKGTELNNGALPRETPVCLESLQRTSLADCA